MHDNDKEPDNCQVCGTTDNIRWYRWLAGKYPLSREMPLCNKCRDKARVREVQSPYVK